MTRWSPARPVTTHTAGVSDENARSEGITTGDWDPARLAAERQGSLGRLARVRAE